MAKTIKNRDTPFDVLTGERTFDDVAIDVTKFIVQKGFCVINPGVGKDVLSAAMDDVENIESCTPPRFYTPNQEVCEGLLGEEGSAEICHIENVGSEDGVGGEGLKKADAVLSEMAGGLAAVSDAALGITLRTRTGGLLHSSGDADDDPTPLSGVEGQMWLEEFSTQRIMLILFLGPIGGRLEMHPFNHSECEPFGVRVAPGTLIALRPDLLSHAYVSLGRSFALSCSVLEPRQGDKEIATDNPVAQELAAWKKECMQNLVLQGKAKQDGVEWDEWVPRAWQHELSRQSQSVVGQQVAIRSISLKMPNSWDPDHWGNGFLTGLDSATLIPKLRWSWEETYDHEPDAYKRMKLPTKHMVYIDGPELFDNKLFTLSVYEAKGCDPCQRNMLELGYEALHQMGFTKKTCMRSLIGVYFGQDRFESNFMPKDNDDDASTTGGAASITSNRLSFCLGLQGPSLTILMENASSHMAIYQGYNSLRFQTSNYKPNHSVLCGGVYLALASTPALLLAASGALSRQGRNLSFDCTADGFLKGDGEAVCGMNHAMAEVDGEMVVDGKLPILGTLRGIASEHCGKSYNVTGSVSGPADQAVIHGALRQAGIRPLDVDIVDCEGMAGLLSDAVEMAALEDALRSSDSDVILGVGACKSGIGTMMATSGMAQLVKTLLNLKRGYLSPNLHLGELNPHMELFGGAPLAVTTESLVVTDDAAIGGFTGHGYGMHSHALVHASKDASVHAPKQRLVGDIVFWPGGGGDVEAGTTPEHGYSIIGSWSSWDSAEPMEKEGKGLYSFTVTLGENRYEQFQILLDSDFERVLHPSSNKAPQNSTVLGPDTSSDSRDLRWTIDGRSGAVLEAAARAAPQIDAAEDGKTLANDPAGDSAKYERYYYVDNSSLTVGMPGSRYRVRLQIAGKWRVVDWQKIADAPALTDGSPLGNQGRYYIVGSWNEWSFTDEMTPDDAAPGTFHAEVSGASGGEFQIVRNKDWGQTFFPTFPTSDGNSSVPTAGPDTTDPNCTWSFKGPKAASWKVTFQRTVLGGESKFSVTWARLNPPAR